MSRLIKRTAQCSGSLSEAMDAMRDGKPWCIRLVLEEGGEEHSFWEVFQPGRGYHGRHHFRPTQMNVYVRFGRAENKVVAANWQYVLDTIRRKVFVGWRYDYAENLYEVAMYWVDSKGILSDRYKGSPRPVEMPKRDPKARPSYPKGRPFVPYKPPSSPSLSPPPIPERDRSQEVVDELMPKETPIEAYVRTSELKKKMRERQRKSEW